MPEPTLSQYLFERYRDPEERRYWESRRLAMAPKPKEVPGYEGYSVYQGPSLSEYILGLQPPQEGVEAAPWYTDPMELAILAMLPAYGGMRKVAKETTEKAIEQGSKLTRKEAQKLWQKYFKEKDPFHKQFLREQVESHLRETGTKSLEPWKVSQLLRGERGSFSTQEIPKPARMRVAFKDLPDDVKRILQEKGIRPQDIDVRIGEVADVPGVTYEWGFKDLYGIKGNKIAQVKGETAEGLTLPTATKKDWATQMGFKQRLSSPSDAASDAPNMLLDIESLGSGRSHITLHVHPESMNKALLPQKSSISLSPEEKAVLTMTKELTSGYRKDVLSRVGIRENEYNAIRQSLIGKGMLTKNGAVTTEAKNLIEDFYKETGYDQLGIPSFLKKAMEIWKSERGSFSTFSTKPLSDEARRAKDFFDRTYLEESPLLGKEIKITSKEHGWPYDTAYLTGRVRERAGTKWYNAFMPYTNNDLKVRAEALGKKVSQLDPGDLGHLEWIPIGQGGWKETGNSILETGKNIIKSERGSFSTRPTNTFEIEDIERGAETTIRFAGKTVRFDSATVDFDVAKNPQNYLMEKYKLPHDPWDYYRVIPKKESLLKSERGSFSTKPLKKTSAHHKVPVGLTPEHTDWHLRNLSEGWKTIEDIPKELHKEITKRQLTTKAEKTFTPEYRKTILEGLATTPERKQLLSETLQELENIITQTPKGTKGYVFGSYPSFKVSPKDLDVFLELPTGRAWHEFENIRPRTPLTKRGLHLTTSPPVERLKTDPLERFKSLAKGLYGPEYDIIRILGLAGLGLPLSQMMGGRAEAQEVNPEYRGKKIKNPDGTYSSERTITITPEDHKINNKFYNIPSLISGKQVNQEQAIDLFKKGKIPAVGVADTLEDAIRQAKERSKMLGSEKKEE